ncbi:hypothetical protein [Sphingomonas sp.]|uniref:hypothetical protein n=1 Tax=Sphingomonas sp. TaxID=28214 RepID=UPI002DB72D95|nr:hypothetical protein [Sphingomonas sp.]HEU4968740.1 hypothetical protein [Sphingomonas sp.]
MISSVSRFAMLAAAVLILGGCDSASSDLATIKTARSLAAERALVARLTANGKLRRAYAEGMQLGAVTQLVSARGALARSDGDSGQAIGAAAALPDQAERLHAAALRLAEIEARREDH